MEAWMNIERGLLGPWICWKSGLETVQKETAIWSLPLCFQGIGHCIQSCIKEMLFSKQNEGLLVSRVKSQVLPFSTVPPSPHLSEHVRGWGNALQCSALSSAPEAKPNTRISAEENQMQTTLAIVQVWYSLLSQLHSSSHSHTPTIRTSVPRSSVLRAQFCSFRIVDTPFEYSCRTAPFVGHWPLLWLCLCHQFLLQIK